MPNLCMQLASDSRCGACTAAWPRPTRAPSGAAAGTARGRSPAALAAAAPGRRRCAPRRQGARGRCPPSARRGGTRTPAARRSSTARWSRQTPILATNSIAEEDKVRDEKLGVDGLPRTVGRSLMGGALTHVQPLAAMWADAIKASADRGGGPRQITTRSVSTSDSASLRFCALLTLPGRHWRERPLGYTWPSRARSSFS